MTSAGKRIVPLTFKVLGSLEVTGHDGASVVVRGIRRRALVLRLLLNPNQVVTSDTLVEDVWSGDPPLGAIGTLQSHVSLLRRLIGPRLRSQPPGYVLDVADDELDALVFEHGLTSGRSLLERGDAPGAAVTLGQMLDLWRGRAMVDVADAEWARAGAERLEQLRVNGVELTAEALLRSGRVDEAVSLVESWVSEQPLRERLWAHLMVGLTRQGRQAEALRAYQRLRQHLGDQLGIEPSPSLIALEDAILMQRPIGDVWQPTLALLGDATSRLGASPRPATPPADSGPSFAQAAPVPLSGAPFVGRERELAAGQEAIRKVLTDRRPLSVVVTGMPGMGCSRYASELAERAAAQGFLIASVSFERAAQEPLRPVAAELGRLANTNLSGEDPQTMAAQADAIGEALAELAREQPVCLVLRDIHRAAPQVLELLMRVAEICARSAILAILTAPLHILDPARRSGIEPALARLVWMLHRHPETVWIELEALGEEDLTRLVKALRPGAGDPARLGRHLLEDTGGNPLLATQMLRSLPQPSAPGPDRQAALVRLVNRWVQRADPALVDAASAAALFEGPVEVSILAEVIGRSRDEVLEDMERAATIQLVEDEGRRGFRVSPPFVARILTQRLGPARRAILHRRIAKVLAERSDPGSDSVYSIAGHWFAGARRADAPAAFEWARRAGRRAQHERNAPQATFWFEIAQRLSELARNLDPRGRAHLLQELIAAKSDAGFAIKATLARAALREAQSTGDPALVAKALIAPMCSVIPVIDGPYRGSLDAILDAAGHLPPAEGGLRALLLSGAAALCEWATSARPESHVAADPVYLASEALALVAQESDPLVVTHVLVFAAYAMQRPDALGQRLAISERGLQAARRANDRDAEAAALLTRMFAAAESGNGAEVNRQLLNLERLAAPGNRPRVVRAALIAGTWRAVLDGDTREAAAKLRRLRDLRGGTPDQQSSLTYTAMSMTVMFEEGRYAELLDLLTSLRGVFPDSRRLQAVTAMTAAHEGDHVTANRLVDHGLGRPDTTQGHAGWLSGEMAWGCAVAQLGRRDHAHSLMERLSPFQAQVDCGPVGHSFCAGPVATVIGALATELGELERAEAYIRQGAELAARLGSPYHQAAAEHAWARMLLRRGASGDARQAADHATEALQLARGRAWSFVPALRRIISGAT